MSTSIRYCIAITDPKSSHCGYINGANGISGIVIIETLEEARKCSGGGYQVVKLNKAICQAYRKRLYRDVSGNMLMPIKDLEIVE